MRSPPDAFQLFPWGLPLVELPLADLAPALKATHLCLRIDDCFGGSTVPLWISYVKTMVSERVLMSLSPIETRSQVSCFLACSASMSEEGFTQLEGASPSARRDSRSV